jgi:hypothetical protein
MTVSKQLDELRQLSDLMLDQRLLALRGAQAARIETQDRIAALDLPDFADGCALAIAARAALLYQTWADVRRKDLNLTLARQTVAEIEAKDAARTAFSKQRVLASLQDRHVKR